MLHLNKSYLIGLRSFLPQVIGLTKQILFETVLQNLSNFKYTIKINGLRTLVIIDHDEEFEQNIHPLSDLEIKIFTLHSNHKYTILDTEAYNNKYFIFDVLLCGGEDLMSKTYQERLDIFTASDEGKHLLNDPKSIFVMKEFVQLTIDNIVDLTIAFDESAKYNGIDIDGLILSNMTKSY